MKFNSLILLSILSFFLLSCDSGLKFENPLEKNDSDSIEAETHDGDGNKTDTSAEQEDKDKTDTVSEYDDDKTDTASTNNGDSGDSKPDPDEDKTDSDNSDTAPEQPDNGDSASEQSDDTDTTPDGDDFQPDDADTSHGNEPEIGDTRETDCTGLPATGAVWNTVSSITQSWNGSAWEPSNIATHNDEASTQECRYRCKEHYTWTNSICKADSKVVNCTEPPANAEWNAVSTISQTWNGSTWEPSNNTTFSEDATTNECHFKCAENYTWNDLKCVGATRIQPCTGLPKNAVWNTAESIQQTWDGYDWTPSSTGVYNTTASTDFCHYQCDEYSSREDSKCVSPCDSEPCVSVENSTGHCIAIDQDKYKCVCETGYFYKNFKCERTALGNICTGQEKCYNNSEEITCPSSPYEDFYGQDAQYTNECTVQSFTASSNVVVDNNTGLTWETSPSYRTYTWDNRAKHCNELNSTNYGGKSKWRVPTSLEILTIADSSRYNPAVNTTIFPDMPVDRLWTSEKQFTLNYIYGYYFISGSGDVGSYLQTSEYKVLCVSGYEMPKGVFTSQTISGSVVVTDSTTGLMWQKEYVTSRTWQQALKYCESLTYAGYSDWRLPNKNELASLLNHDKKGTPYSDFPDMPSDREFWSSSTYDVGNGARAAWSVDFSGFSLGGSSKTTNSNAVRCVRSQISDRPIDEECTATGGTWDSGECTRTANCSSKPANTVWNDNGADGTYMQTWNSSSGWSSYSSSYNATTAGTCRFKCVSGYTWTGESCMSTLPECQKNSFPCKDSRRGYIWSKKASSMTWENAKSYCDSLTESGLSGWHLPTISELRTLIQQCPGTVTGGSCGVTDSCLSYSSSCWTESDCGSYSCSADSSGGHSKFGDTDTLWSSSLIPSYWAWNVNFLYGHVHYREMGTKFYVRCVMSEE